MFVGLILCASAKTFGNPPLYSHIKTIQGDDIKDVGKRTHDAIEAFIKEDQKQGKLDGEDYTQFCYLPILMNVISTAEHGIEIIHVDDTFEYTPVDVEDDLDDYER